MRMVGDSSSSIIAAMVSGFEYSSQYSLIANLPSSSSSSLLMPNLSMPSPSELPVPVPAPAPAPLPPPPPHPPHPSELSPHKSAAGQWGVQETRDFIAARSRLEKEFRQRKRNKLLWDAVAARMRDLGYRRTADQCKCKWKNLVNRYKGKETSEAADDGRQFAFFDDMQAIFVERAKTSNKHLLESDQPQHTAMPMPVPVPRRKRKKPRKGGERSSEEILSLEEEDDDEDDDNEEDADEEEEEEAESVEEERVMAMSKKRKQKAERERQRATAERSRAKSMKEVLEEFLEQQQRLEMEWKEGVERREQERRAREQSWREEMEALENERIQREQAWREREERRRAKEEERAMQRDALFSALLLRLARDNV